jgi:hypothetical protein
MRLTGQAGWEVFPFRLMQRNKSNPGLDQRRCVF